MGGAFDPKTKVFLCNGQGITNELDKVFRNPADSKYKRARRNNSFDRVLPDAQDNWKDLIIAYAVAGVDVGDEWAAWCAYLEALGRGPQGPQNIYLIAQTRFNALRDNKGIETKTHGGGSPVHTTPGSGGNPITIDSPCPPPS